MAHHRGLVVTLIVAVVVWAAFIGTMAAATNDTDECVLDDVAADALGPVLIEPQSQKGLAVTGGRGYGIEPVSIVRGRVTRPCPPRQSFDEDADNLSLSAHVHQVAATANSVSSSIIADADTTAGV